MDFSNFKLSFSYPLDEKGYAAKLLISTPNWFTMQTHCQPLHGWSVLGLLGSLFFMFLPTFTSVSDDYYKIFIAALVFFGVLIFYIYADRTINCTFNKQTGRIEVLVGGILDLPLIENKFVFRISEIKNFEMIRYTTRGRDRFQIGIMFENGERISISAKNLDFTGCQEYAEKIRDFLELDVPIKAVDGSFF